MQAAGLKPRIVVIGGGTGTFALLSGLKHCDADLTALVGMADDGGSTGLLRDELGVLPPGDIRKCLVALARVPQMRDLFNYRFDEGSLAGHSFGNLFLTAVEKMTDNFSEAVELAGKVLNISGRVLPATLDKVTLVLEQPDGTHIRGESVLDHGSHKLERPKVRLEPHARLTPESRQALLDADLIVVAPGSIYGSLAAVLVVDGMAEAIRASSAIKAYVCNLVTENGQSEGFYVHDFADEIERFLGGNVPLDYVLYNTHKPTLDLLERYAAEGDFWVEYDPAELAGRHYKAVGGNYVAEPTLKHPTLIRHDAHKIAKTLLELYRQRHPAKTKRTHELQPEYDRAIAVE